MAVTSEIYVVTRQKQFLVYDTYAYSSSTAFIIAGDRQRRVLFIREDKRSNGGQLTVGTMPF